MSSRVAPFPASSGFYRRWISELPRISHPSAVPIDRFPRLPRFFAPSVSPMMSFRVAPNSHLPAPAGGYPSFLGSHLPALPLANLQVAPKLRSSGSSVRLNLWVAPNFHSFVGRRLIKFSGCPKSSILQLIRLCFPGLPRFRIYGWVDDESPDVFELCILG